MNFDHTDTSKTLSTEEIDIDELIERNQRQGASKAPPPAIDLESPDVAKPQQKGTRQIAIEWRNLKCVYPGNSSGKEDKTTLFNASGNLMTGELTAIMGHSGSGKSTLLDILSGLKTTGNITGTINVFGKEVTDDMNQASKLLRNATSFVPQDVAFFPMQTPEESVQFVARLQHNNSEDTSLDRCHKLLRDCGLTNPELYTRPIGGELAGGLHVRGLSGGERKRLALACALAMKPQLIMLDEITSGLDSENAHATIQLVKQVCVCRNVAAAVVIHQPDGYIFQEFDRLVLLAKGACVFSDRVDRLGELYRDHFNMEMPRSPHEVPLDLMRKLGKIDPLAGAAIGATFQDNREHLHHVGSFAKQRIKDDVPDTKKLMVVLGRNLTNHYLRNLTNLGARMFAYTACSFMDGTLFFGVGDRRDESIIGGLAFITLISYLLPFVTIPVFVHEKHFFIMERQLGLYSPWIYCISQAFLEMCLIVLAAFIEASIVVPMVGLWNPSQSKLESFFTMLAGFVASGLTGSSLVLLSATMMPSQDLGFLFASSMVTLWLGLSGGMVPLTLLKDWISWLQWISPCKYTMNALATGVFGGTDEEAILDRVGLNRPSSVAANIFILLGIYLLFSIGTMAALTAQRGHR